MKRKNGVRHLIRPGRAVDSRIFVRPMMAMFQCTIWPKVLNLGKLIGRNVDETMKPQLYVDSAPGS